MSNNKDLMQDILYMQALQPTKGCEVDFAVGTTYSLSMDGLVAVPLALSRTGEPKEVTTQSALYLMSGIRRASDKFVVFCNKGSIHVPANTQPLYSLLEYSIIEVSDKDNPLANFHPKMWVVRETSDKGNYIKIIITSRNLTFSTDLDAAVVIRGKISEKVENKKNAPLAKMLEVLAMKASCAKEMRPCRAGLAERIKKVASDLMCVDSFDFDSPMSPNVYSIHPLLPGNKECKGLEVSALYGRRVLIISPFIDSDVDKGLISQIINGSSKRYGKPAEVHLVTNYNNVTEKLLEKFNSNSNSGNVYVPHGLIVENDKAAVQLHAKIYLVEREPSKPYMYIGSANATINGFKRNSELMIGMRVNDADFDTIFDELVTKDGLYVQATMPMVSLDEEKKNRDAEGDMEHIIRWVMNSMVSAEIKEQSTANSYRITLEISPQDSSSYSINSIEGYEISIRPLQSSEGKVWNASEKKMQWELCISQLSELYVVDVKCGARTKSRICKVATNGFDLYVGKRDENIINSIVKSDNIMQYLDIILSEFPEYAYESWETRKKQGGNASGNGKFPQGPSLYEKLLKASHESPDKIKELHDIVNKLDSEKGYGDLVSLLKAFGINFRRSKR